MAAHADVDRGQASLPYTLTTLGFGVGCAVTGKAVDRISITAALVACSVTMGAFYLLASYSESLVVLSGLQCAIGFVLAAPRCYYRCNADSSLHVGRELHETQEEDAGRID